MRRFSFGAPFSLLALSIAGCFSGDREVNLGAVGDVAGLVEASAPEGRPPEPVVGVSPRVSAELADALDQATADVEVVVRVLVGEEGAPIGVSVLEARPEGSATAERYAEAVEQAVWEWQYKPAKRHGSPVRGYVDLRFRYGATKTDAG